MTSFRGQVCAMADSSVSAIQFSALYAGIKMETNGVRELLSPAACLLRLHCTARRL